MALIFGVPAAALAGLFLVTRGAGLWDYHFGWVLTTLTMLLLLVRLVVVRFANIFDDARHHTACWRTKGG